MHFGEQCLQRLPPRLLALCFVGGQRTQVLVLLEANDDCQRSASLLENNGVLQVGDGSPISNRSF